MTEIRFVPNPAGFAEVLRSPEMAAVVHAAAERVAAHITAQGITAHSGAGSTGAQLVGIVEDEVTDRARSVVKVEHPAALAMQAKLGMVTKAASAAGLEVRAK